jgi:hypothetical protein
LQTTFFADGRYQVTANENGTIDILRLAPAPEGKKSSL